MDRYTRMPYFLSVLRSKPPQVARLAGAPEYADVRGLVRFYNTPVGVLVAAEVYHLPAEEENNGQGVFAFHVHESGPCEQPHEMGKDADPFAMVGTHYNPQERPHPYHAGDMPPLFSNNGYAFQVFLTNRFTLGEIKGKTVIIHKNVDDFTTQPSGGAGEKIACGDIRMW